MTILAPETEARLALLALLTSEFAAEKLDARDDRLHASLGQDGPIAGCYPAETVPGRSVKLVNEIHSVVQVFAKWNKIVDPEQTVSPRLIEEWAERFRRRVHHADPQTAAVWYFEIERIRYPADPTGNSTRFEATVIARGNNSALIETIG